MAVGEETPDPQALDETELGRRRAALRKFPRNRALSDEQLNEMILQAGEKKAGRRRRGTTGMGGPTVPVVSPTDAMKPEYVSLFRKVKREFLKEVKGDLAPGYANRLTDMAALGYILVIQAVKEGADARSLKELYMAALSTIREMGQTKPERRKDKTKQQDDILGAVAASKENVMRASQERAAGREAVKARLETKQIKPEHGEEN